MVGVARRMKLSPALQRRQAKLVVFLRRQVDDDQAVDAGGLGVGEECVDAVDVDRIVVAHQHDRRRVVVLAERAHQRERLHHGLAGVERAQARGLDRRPVGHRIGERHAELDHVGAGLRQRLEDRERRSRQSGSPAMSEGDERGAAFALQLGEARVDAGGHFLRTCYRDRPSGKRLCWLRSRISAMRDVDGAEHDPDRTTATNIDPFLRHDRAAACAAGEQPRLQEIEDVEHRQAR